MTGVQTCALPIWARREIAAEAFDPLLKHQRRLMDAVDAGDPNAAVRVTEESFDDAIRRIRAGLGDQAAD